MPGTARACWGPGRGPRRPPAAVGDGAGRVHQTPQTRSSDERRARASVRWAECRAFEAEPAGEEAATLARGPRLTGTALRTDTELANGSRSIKPQWPCNRERNRARSHRPFHEERVRPRRLSEPGRPVTEGASDSNPVNGFRGGSRVRPPVCFVGLASVPVRARRRKNPEQNSSKQNLPAC